MTQAAPLSPRRHDGRLATYVPALGLTATVAALLGVSCCVLPIALAVVGLGGAWVAHLSVFVAIGPYLLAAAAAAVALGWWIGLRRRISQLGYAALGIATIGLGLAVLVRLYELELNRYLATLWRGQ